MSVVDELRQKNPDALLLEPREVYDEALIGVTDSPDDQWPRETNTVVAVYSAEKCIEVIMRADGCDYFAAQEWFNYNTSGAWVGENTPTFVWEDDDWVDDDLAVSAPMR